VIANQRQRVDLLAVFVTFMFEYVFRQQRVVFRLIVNGSLEFALVVLNPGLVPLDLSFQQLTQLDTRNRQLQSFDHGFSPVRNPDDDDGIVIAVESTGKLCHD
jgi:hypothetical protein